MATQENKIQETAKRSYELRYSKKTKNRATPWAEIRRKVIERDGMNCTYCGCDVFVNSDDQRVSLIIEHMYTRHETLDNLCVACRRCNSQKNSKSFSEWLENIERKLLKETSLTEIARFLAQKEYIQNLESINIEVL